MYLIEISICSRFQLKWMKLRRKVHLSLPALGEIVVFDVVSRFVQNLICVLEIPHIER